MHFRAKNIRINRLELLDSTSHVVPVESRVDSVRAQSRRWRREGHKVALIPTMGALHAGHLSLIEQARAKGADRVIVSIFVNPTQFGKDEDLDRYPQDLEGDLEMLRSVDVDLLFAPSVDTVYPSGCQTTVTVEHLPQHLCGLSRPGHFDGVATVVSILFHTTEPDLAVFGEKDFQQLQVIRQMVRDQHMPTRIVSAPIVREADGLAMSSRNAHLSGQDRVAACSLHRALTEAQAMVAKGERDVSILTRQMRSTCVRVGGRIDYASIVDPTKLSDLIHVNAPARALLAVYFGSTRLIDNAPIGNIESL